MKCPFCKYADTKVTDSRVTDDGNAIRRRRECLSCHRRFTTYELVEEAPLMVIKRDGHREMFDGDKLLRGLMRACEKREVSVEQIKELVASVERELRNRLVQEISSEELGEVVLAKLSDLDPVAYIRFASVYRRFSGLKDFMAELETLMAKEEQKQKGVESK
ncbi:transcriptional repressor NrdR [Negativicoccus succinicivorans]|uniref:Transcriptional repressor NrdR n=1 Tax=Negativicoccus succinicivorans TaxID=620903 RepID=A0A841QZF4_9FIRM|nr:transcriptional regulator NrdR [Negativicoccus succinicivorans]MBB6477065.1 transcriptional repressor NrdR [Negativicoccus succinicivorans]MBS5890137.1 transcriptional regulator NrdR [Negativicoccus succinicivorans]MDU0986751.1 transcriptional regulator NrdR [Negativicoccus succinicivorans]MDU1055998.1 transcriptional regulator NrdR [Negativicoccus succinicivorans]MDU1066017.1 transcriptional regulator NrdR [Negativicoccus succinicivorans]